VWGAVPSAVDGRCAPKHCGISSNRFCHRIDRTVKGRACLQRWEQVRSSVAERQTSQRGRRAACAVTGDGNRPWLWLQIGGRRSDPFESRHGVFDRGRPRVFGCALIVHGQYRRPRSGSQAAARPVVHFEVADYPASSVQIDHDG